MFRSPSPPPSTPSSPSSPSSGATGLRGSPAPSASPGTPAASAASRRLRGLVRNGLQTLGVGALVAVFLSLLFDQSYLRTLVFSECIALSCWAFIDGGRLLAARWVNRPLPGRPAVPVEKADWPGWPLMLCCVLLGTAAGSMVGNTLANWLTGNTLGHDHVNARGLATLVLISLVPGIATTYFFWSRGHMQAVQARAETAQRQAAENQLRLLESQLEPHMLFNTLANLRALISLDPPRAQLMLDRLIGFLRATLSASRVHQHPLSLEFARVADYLALMKIRMGDRLQDELLLPEALARHLVPPLLLQPLVENAIRHGLEPHLDGGRLQVSAALEGDQLVLKVRDTGAGLPMDLKAQTSTPGTGFGLEQVRERLSTLYGGAASFELRPAAALDAEGGTLATVRLPASVTLPSTDS